MDATITIVIVIGISIVLSAIISVRIKQRKPTGQVSRKAIIRSATKKLSQNPHNTAGLLALSNLYYSEHDWAKALPLLSTMLDISAVHPEINIAKTALQIGISAFNCGNMGEALRGLGIAKNMIPDDIEVNFYLGQAYYKTKNYDKAIACLKISQTFSSFSADAQKYLGLALYQQQHYAEAYSYCKRALETIPEDSELLFAVAEALHYSGNDEKSLPIYSRLYEDPKYGAQACLAAGKMNLQFKNYEEAIKIYERGCLYTNVPGDILSEMHYQLAQAYFQFKNFENGLRALKALLKITPGYKDADTMKAYYQELHENANLKIYLMGSEQQALVLCRKLTAASFPKAQIINREASSAKEIIDIPTIVINGSWESIVFFRFVRSTGLLGEFFVREFFEKIREYKADKGICITAGSFQPSARKSLEGRPIDLVDKSRLLKLLQSSE